MDYSLKMQVELQEFNYMLSTRKKILRNKILIASKNKLKIISYILQNKILK